jgi:FHS family L-fucose permease-like MFS transporter
MAIASVGKTATVTSQPASTNYAAMAVVTTLFFMWGFLTSLNDVLVPHFKGIFNLDFGGASLVQAAFFSSYFVFAFPAGKVVEWVGYKRTMVVGLLITGAGTLFFIPAANVPSFRLFLVALVVLAAGITVLQVSANPFVSVLGPERTASSRLNLTQAFNSLGTTVAPWVGGRLILSAAPKDLQEIRAMPEALRQAYRIQEASTVKMPYLVFSILLALLAIAVILFKLPRIETTRDFRPAQGVKKDRIFHYPHLLLGAVAIFLYVGAEVSIGSYLISYFNEPNTGNMTVQAAARLVSLYWGGAMIGRFIGSYALKKVRPNFALGVCAIIACALVSISILTFGHVAVWSILLVGLFNSIMFPTIFTLGIAELGPLTGEGSGILVAAIVGGAVIPFLEGHLADQIGLHYAFILPALCYVYLAYYGFRGSRPRRLGTA